MLFLNASLWLNASQLTGHIPGELLQLGEPKQLWEALRLHLQEDNLACSFSSLC
jgi:hypothetical protein